MPGLTGLSAIQPIPFGGGAGGHCDFLLLAPFDGAPDQGYVDTQVLDTEAEGIAVDQLTVVEVDGTVSLTSDHLRLDGNGGSSGYAFRGAYNNTGHAKVLGRALIMHMEFSSSHWSHVGLKNTPGVFAFNVNTGIDFRRNNVANITVRAHGEAAVAITPAMLVDVDYQLAIVMGGYDVNSQPWYEGAVGTFDYGFEVLVKGGTFTNWTLIWKSIYDNDSPLYPYVSLYNGGAHIDDYQYIRIPDHDYSEVLQPTVCDWFTNPGAPNVPIASHTPDVCPTGSSWALVAGDYQVVAADYLYANANGSIAVIESGLSDIFYKGNFYITSGRYPALIFRWQDSSNYIMTRYNHISGAFEIVEYVAGVPNVVATVAAALGLNSWYEMTVTALGTEIQAWIDGAYRISGTTSNMQTETICGVSSGITGERWDNLVLKPADGYTALNSCPGYPVTP